MIMEPNPTAARDSDQADAEFWRLHAEWRVREDAANSGGADDDEAVDALVARSDEVLLPMMAHPVTTASALLAKLNPRDIGCHGLGREITKGFTFFDAIRRDIENLANSERPNSVSRGKILNALGDALCGFEDTIALAIAIESQIDELLDWCGPNALSPDQNIFARARIINSLVSIMHHNVRETFDAIEKVHDASSR